MTKSIFSTEEVKVQLTTLSTTQSMPFYLATTAGSAIAIAGLLTWFTMKKSSAPKTKEKYELYFTRFIVVTVNAEVAAYFVLCMDRSASDLTPSDAGIRTRVAWVRTMNPNQLDYMGYK